MELFMFVGHVGVNVTDPAPSGAASTCGFF
jgi:hypothetical protein